MKQLILIISVMVALASCSNKSTYTKACASNPAGSSKNRGAVSGKEISVKRVNNSTYRNFSRRPHKLGLLRR